MASTLLKLVDETIPDIYLQQITKDDATEQYVNWLNDPMVNRYLETRFMVQTLASVSAFIDNINVNPNEHLFTIRLSATGQHIGNIKLGAVNGHHGYGDISLFIGEKSCWGKGYASQAIKLISQYGLEQLGLRKLCAGAYEPNIGSTNAFLKAGFIHDGVLKAHYLLDGSTCDRIQVCLFSED